MRVFHFLFVSTKHARWAYPLCKTLFPLSLGWECFLVSKNKSKMLPIQTTLLPKSFSLLFHSKLVFSSTLHSPKPPPRVVVSARSDPKPDPKPRPEPGSKPKRRTKAPRNDGDEANSNRTFPATIPRKPRRGRRSEAVAVEDFVRDTLDRTFAAIREQNSETPEIMKKRLDDDDDDEDDEEDEDNGGDKVVVEEESSNWPLDAEVGWGIRASEYFEQHPIKNVVGEDGVEIDWEGELETGWVKEINCLEWESFAFHPSPLIVLVFERYNRASDNWKVLKELEKAAKVYWSAKDRLPPRTVKIDINIERDMAYALQAKECPQILFLRGNRILYREKDFRTADELVHMIAYFYYNAKRPSCISDSALFSR